MTFSLIGEGFIFGKELEKVEAMKAKERQRVHGGTAPGKKNSCDHLNTSEESPNYKKTQDIVAKQVGLGSRGTYGRAKAVVLS